MLTNPELVESSGEICRMMREEISVDAVECAVDLE